MKICTLPSVPELVRENLPITLTDSQWSYLRNMCPFVWALHRNDGSVLAIIGLRASNLVATEAELWAVPIGDSRPKVSELRKGRKLIKELLASLPYKTYAETYSKTDRRFAEWFGFVPRQEGETYTLLEEAV